MKHGGNIPPSALAFERLWREVGAPADIFTNLLISPSQTTRLPDDSRMSKLLAVAIFLMILGVILRVALALTGVFLDLIWILVIVFAVLWLFGKLGGSE